MHACDYSHDLGKLAITIIKINEEFICDQSLGTTATCDQASEKSYIYMLEYVIAEAVLAWFVSVHYLTVSAFSAKKYFMS